MLSDNDHENMASSPVPQDACALQKSEIERLGRQRPDAFSSTTAEVLFCSSMLISMLMSEFYVSGFFIILPNISLALSIPPSSQIWPSSVFSLVLGALLLPMSRLADMLGAFTIFNLGLVWFFIWTLAAGFSPNYPMLIATRALQGLGPAAFLPTGIMILGKTYRPGPRKNLIFSLYGAFAPLGFFLGVVVGGVAGEYLTWGWYFWLGSIVIGLVAVASLFTVPRERGPQSAVIGMDWWGVVTIVPALVLVVFAVTDGAHAPRGWGTDYIIVAFVLGVLLLAAFVYVEGWVSPQPLLPASLFKPKHMKTLVASLCFAYGTFGIFMYYAAFYLTNVMGYNSIQTALAFVPMAAGGVVLATVGGFTLHFLPGRLLLIFSGTGFVACVLLFAIIPASGSYWAYVLPAMLGATIGIDITYNASNIFITTNLPHKHQGAAGALINSLLFLPISLFLGLADVVAASYEERGVRASYKAALWFGTGCAGLALVLFCFIDTGKAESQLSVEEREAVAQDQSEDLRRRDVQT